MNRKTRAERLRDLIRTYSEGAKHWRARGQGEQASRYRRKANDYRKLLKELEERS